MSRKGETIQGFEMAVRSSSRSDLPVQVSILESSSSASSERSVFHFIQPIDSTARLARALERLTPGTAPTAAAGAATSRSPLSGSPDPHPLRENEVLRHVAAGLQNKEVATELGISVATTRNHVHNILEKLDVHSKLEAVSLAFREGWVTGAAFRGAARSGTIRLGPDTTVALVAGRPQSLHPDAATAQGMHARRLSMGWCRRITDCVLYTWVRRTTLAQDLRSRKGGCPRERRASGSVSWQAIAKRRQQELDILAAVALRIHEEEDPQAVIEIALDEIVGGLGLKAAWVFLGDENEKQLRLAAHRGVSVEYLQEVDRSGLGHCLCPEVFSTGHRMQIRNTTQCPRMPTIVDGLREPVAHACIPLALEGTSRGVLNVAARPGQLLRGGRAALPGNGRPAGLPCHGASPAPEGGAPAPPGSAGAGGPQQRIGEIQDPDAVLRGVGQTALEILGSDRVQIFLGSDPRELTVAHLAGLPHPELREGQKLDLVSLGSSLLPRALAEQRSFQVEEGRHDDRVNQDLAHRWEAVSALVVPLVARKTTLGLLLLTKRDPQRWTKDQVDVAEALASQASVAIENARLYDNARRAYRELKAAQARIIQSEKMAVVGTFASGLAHEVRNPLNSIALQLSILERRVAPLETGLSGELKELLGIIREEVKRLDNLVGDFLQFSRTNRLPYSPASVDSLLDEVVRLLRPEARAAGVTLKRQQAGASIPDLRIDAERIKQVVINLVQNAIEAMPDGGAAVLESGLVDGRASDRGARHGTRAARGARRLPALRHHQGPRHGPRPFDRPADRPRARRRDLGGESRRAGRGLHRQPSAIPPEETEAERP